MTVAHLSRFPVRLLHGSRPRAEFKREFANLTWPEAWSQPLVPQKGTKVVYFLLYIFFFFFFINYFFDALFSTGCFSGRVRADFPEGS